VQQREGVVLHRHVVRLQRGLHLVHPALDDFGVHANELDARDERGSRDESVLVHERLLEVALDLREHGRVSLRDDL